MGRGGTKGGGSVGDYWSGLKRLSEFGYVDARDGDGY